VLSHEYETIIIVRPDLEDSAVFGIAELVEQIVLKSEGHVLDREDWGKRKLSYPIAKHQRGHYMRLNYLCAPRLIEEIEFKIRTGTNDQVVRFMTLRLATAVDAPTRIEQAAIQRARREEEMKRRAAEAALGLGDDDDDDFGDDDDDDDNIGGGAGASAGDR